VLWQGLLGFIDLRMPPFLPLDRYPTFVTSLDQQLEHLSDGHLTLAEWHQPAVAALTECADELRYAARH
jgi:hypothetical protein